MRRNLLPLSGGTGLPRVTGGRDPLAHLQQEMSRLVDDVWRGMPEPANLSVPLAGPRMDIHEDDDNLLVTADVPGLDAEEIDVSYDEGVLRIAGEHKRESGDRRGELHLSERIHGRFERRIPLAAPIREDAIEARVDNGVLTITLPKAAETDDTRRIPVKRAA